MRKIGLLIIDDHSAVRSALAIRLGSLPHIEVVGMAGDVTEGLAYIRDFKPDIVLLEPKSADWHGRQSGVTEFQEGSFDWQNGHPTAVIVLTSYMDEKERESAFQAGARRYLLKDIDSERLIGEIEAVAAELLSEASGVEVKQSVASV